MIKIFFLLAPTCVFAQTKVDSLLYQHIEKFRNDGIVLSNSVQAMTDNHATYMSNRNELTHYQLKNSNTYSAFQRFKSLLTSEQQNKYSYIGEVCSSVSSFADLTNEEVSSLMFTGYMNSPGHKATLSPCPQCPKVIYHLVSTTVKTKRADGSFSWHNCIVIVELNY